MHELGLMTSVADAVEKQARAAGAREVLGVDVHVGVMTEAIPDSLEFAWEVLRETNPYIKNANLTLTMIEPQSTCLECGHTYTHDRFVRTCPKCGANHSKLIHGRDLTIESMEVDIP